MQPQSPQSTDQAPLPAGDSPQIMPQFQVPAGVQPNPTPAIGGSEQKAGEPAMPDVADDGDVIEKEWVGKVKQVTRQTAHDPYELNRQFTQIKADYMQKRYGKAIKVDD